MSEIINLPTAPGKPESKAISLPLRGPFVKLDQHALVNVGGVWQQFVEANRDSIIESFDLSWGYIVYQNDGYNRVSIAGYYLDTSD